MLFGNLHVALAFVGVVSAAPQLHQHKARGQCRVKAASSGAAWANQPSYLPGGPSTLCYTQLDSTTVPWASSTEWSTSYTACVTTSTVTATVTTAPSSTTTTSTTTATITSTAATTVLTSTETATATTSTTVTTTTTTTQTNTATTTTTTSTSTIATSSGFIPVQSSLPGSSYGGSDGANPVVKRDDSPKSGHVGVSQNQFPQGVKCYSYAPKSCSTTTTTVTTTVQATSTGIVTATSTSTSTSTIVPSATTTVTTTTTTTGTVTETDTATTTTTTTTTVSVSATVYAACASINLADTYNGQSITSARTPGRLSDLSIYSLYTRTAYDCCVAGLMYSKPLQVFVHDTSGSCTIVYNAADTCPGGQAGNTFRPVVIAGVGGGTIGNGICGEIIA